MKNTLKLPSHLQGHNLFHAVEGFLVANPELPSVIVIDFANLKFARPPSVAFLSNFSQWLLSKGSEVRFTGLDTSSEPIKYLDDSLFFQQHTGTLLRPHSVCRTTTMPLRQLARRDSHAWLETVFLPWLIQKSGLSKNSLAEFKSSLQEIINNISDHTVFEEGCIFGQWYPKNNQIIVTVADFGSGIPPNVAKVIPDLTDSEAIVKSAEDGFSSKSIPSNRGAGLYLLLLNIVKRFGGVVTIRSHNGYARFAISSGDISISTSDRCGYCIGTTIDIVLNTDQIPYDDDVEEDLSW